MKNLTKRLPFFAPVVLRIGLSGVFIWFGVSQILNPSVWTSYIPDIAVRITELSAFALVIFNGIFEICMAILLVFGIWIRPVAGLLFLHMCEIVATVGLDPIGVRDVAIAAGLLSTTFYGYDVVSWHYDPLEIPKESLPR